MSKRIRESLKTSSIVIIGKGSKLYQGYFRSEEFREYSTSEFRENDFHAMDYEVILVFSLLTQSDLVRLRTLTNGIVIIIGSCSAISSLSERFVYSRLKRDQLAFIESADEERFKYLVFGDFIQSKRRGLVFYSDLNSFWDQVVLALESKEKVINCFSLEGCVTRTSKLLSRIDSNFAPYSSVVIKYLTPYTYGYNNAENLKKYY